ncbi:MAG: hypothetical protein ACR2PO_16035 [Methyloligellaceae bacterium]
MSGPRLASIVIAFCIAGSGAARAEIPCMSDEELFGYLFNVATISIVTRAGLCARQFPLLQPQFDDILAEDNSEFERQRAKAAEAFRRADPGKGEAVMNDAVRDAAAKKGRGQVMLEDDCTAWYGRLAEAKRAGGNYSAVFSTRTKADFDAARARVPLCARR